MSRWKWILSWTPLVAVLLLAFTLWVFLFRSTGEGGTSLLPPACALEKTQNVTRDNFEIVWRERGCESVSPSIVQKASDWLKYWNQKRESIHFQSLLPETTVDIRSQTKDKVFWRLGEPGALLWQSDSSPQGQYLLFRGLNELALREAFPEARNLRLLAGALAIQIVPDGGLRLILSPREREVAESLPNDWAEQLTECQGKCLEKLYPQ